MYKADLILVTANEFGMTIHIEEGRGEEVAIRRKMSINDKNKIANRHFFPSLCPHNRLSSRAIARDPLLIIAELRYQSLTAFAEGLFSNKIPLDQKVRSLNEGSY